VSRGIRGILLLLLLVCLLLTNIVYSQKEYVAEVLPAPVGYVYAFTSRGFGRIVGFRISGKYYPYRALPQNGVVIFPFPDIDKIVTPRGVYSIHKIFVEDVKPYVIMVENAPYDFILAGDGEVYTSPWKIYYNSPPRRGGGQNAIIIGVNRVEIGSRFRWILFVTRPVITVIENNTSKDMRVTELLRIPRQCIVHFEGGTIWSAGIIPLPACLGFGRIVVVKKILYRGQPYAVAVRTVKPALTVVFAPPSAQVLEHLGILTRIHRSRFVHVIVTSSVRGEYVYYAGDPRRPPREVARVIAEDATITVNGAHICAIPEHGAEPVYMVVWRQRSWRTVNTSVKLLPGEVVLFRAGGRYYVCHGDVRWADAGTPPSITAPAYREFLHPILIRSDQYPVLVVLANGRIYYGMRLKVPYGEYDNNEMWIVYGRQAFRYTYTPSSIFLTPQFIMASIVVVFLILFAVRRTPPPPPTVVVTWDLPMPEAHRVASPAEIHDVATKHVEHFGVCPSDIEIVYRHHLLPPIPEDIPDPQSTILYCPFHTNVETEQILRSIVRVLHAGLWGIKRCGRSHGYIYTIYGGYFLYMYFYKQEKEAKPEQLIYNALRAASRVRIETPHHLLPLGLLIVAKPGMVEKLRREIDFIRKLSVASGHQLEIVQYFSMKLSEASDKERLQKFVDEKVPVIMAVSNENVTELVEYLAEKFRGIAEEYHKTVGLHTITASEVEPVLY